MALTISRSDVESDHITEFPVESRFIKLPISAYLELLNGDKEDETNAPQRALINAINNPKYRFLCAALSRRLGKTYIANIIGQLVTLVPNSHVLIISPNYNLSSISFELQRKLIRHFNIELVRDNVKDRVLELENGSTIRMGSVSQVDSTVGRSYSLIIFDEAALTSDGEDAFNVALRPTLDKPGSKAIFISTPRGKKNWFSRFYHRGFSDDFPQWVSIHADYLENPRMTEDDVQEARKSMSRAEFEQEYMASFVSFEGQIFHLPQENIISYYPDDPTLEVFAGLDPGYKDPTAFVVILYSPKQEVFYIVDEYQNNETTTEGHAKAIKKLIEKWNIDTIFIDSAAAQFAADLAYTYDIPTSKSKKDRLPGITYCQSIIDNGRLFVHSNCIHTLDMLDQYQWDNTSNNTREKPLHNEFSHIADAVRYSLYTYAV